MLAVVCVAHSDPQHTTQKIQISANNATMFARTLYSCCPPLQGSMFIKLVDSLTHIPIDIPNAVICAILVILNERSDLHNSKFFGDKSSSPAGVSKSDHEGSVFKYIVLT
jgi:hypothetical protein